MSRITRVNRYTEKVLDDNHNIFLNDYVKVENIVFSQLENFVKVFILICIEKLPILFRVII